MESYSTASRLSSQPGPPGLSSSYLLRHWRGGFGLALSFWLNGALIGAIPLALVFALLGPARLWSGMQGALAPLIGWPVVLVIEAWQLVGLHRSAQRSIRERRGDGTVAVLVSGFAMVTGVASLAVVGFLGSTEIRDSIQALSGSPQLQPTAITVLGDGTMVEFDGGIRLGSALQFEETLARAPKATTVAIDSTGGLDGEAHAMEEVIRRHGLTTLVRKECSGSAVFPFLAGRERVVTDGAVFGFQTDVSRLTKAINGGDPLERELKALGADPDFVALASYYPSEKPFGPSDQELVKQHVATRLADPHDYPLDAVDMASLDEDWLKTLLFKDALAEAYAEGSPKAFAEFLKGAVATLKAGKPVGEVSRALAVLVDDAKRRAAAAPSYAAIDKITEWAIALLSYNKDYTPKEALELFFHVRDTSSWTHDDIVQHVAHYPFDDEKAVWIDLLKDPADPAGPANRGSRAEILKIAESYCQSEPDRDFLAAGIPESTLGQMQVAGIWAQTLVEIHAKSEEERWPLEAYLCTAYRH